jgi:hypothetical protein
MKKIAANPLTMPRGERSHREHLGAGSTDRASVMGKPPIRRNVVFCGVKIFRIADGKFVRAIGASD